MNAISIRFEKSGDEAAIHALTAAAFADMPFSAGDEPELVDALRAAGDLSLSLVAVNAAAIVGHIAFSQVTISDGSRAWFGLGPVSVAPVFQRLGIGSALIKRGLADMRERGARGIVLLGSPAYYSRFGFQNDPKLCYPGPPPPYFQRLVLTGKAPSGVVTYVAAFG